MLQRIIFTAHILLVVAGIGLFLSGPIGREALRAAGALLIGAGLLGLTRRQPVK